MSQSLQLHAFSNACKLLSVHKQLYIYLLYESQVWIIQVSSIQINFIILHAQNLVRIKMKITVGGVLWCLCSMSVVMSAAQGNNTFCVTSCTQCPNTTLDGCHDLSWYAAHGWSSSEVTLMFTSGDHVLALGDFWWIQNLTSISFVGYGDLTKYVSSGSYMYNTSLSRILCSNLSGIAFSNITQISITNLIISGCGAQLYQAGSTNTAVYFNNITNLTIINTSIEQHHWTWSVQYQTSNQNHMSQENGV